VNKSYGIFDLDGTLVDSMEWWKGLAEEFLRSQGVEKLPDSLLSQIKTMTIPESAALFIRIFGISGTVSSVAEEMNALMDRHYREDISLKPGVKAYLRRLKEKGIRMCVASATSKELVEACLKRLGAADYFEAFLSCEDVGAGKTRPDIYLEAARKMNCRPDEALVVEDALHAIETAKKAGFSTAAVYDKANKEQEKIRETADIYLKSFDEQLTEMITGRM